MALNKKTLDPAEVFAMESIRIDRKFSVRYSIGNSSIQRKFCFDKASGLNMDPEKKITISTEKQRQSMLKKGKACGFVFGVWDLYEVMKLVDRFMKFHPEYSFFLCDETATASRNKNYSIPENNSEACTDADNSAIKPCFAAMGRYRRWNMRGKYRTLLEIVSGKELSSRIRLVA